MNRAIARILPRDPATLIADRFERDICGIGLLLFLSVLSLIKTSPATCLVAR